MKKFIILIILSIYPYFVYAPTTDWGFFKTENHFTHIGMLTPDNVEEGLLFSEVSRISNLVEKNIDEFSFWQEHSLLPCDFRKEVFRWNKDLKIPVYIIYNLIWMESRWTYWAVGNNTNGTRDLGLMQLNSNYVHLFVDRHFTQESVSNFDPFNPAHSLEVGLKHLSALYTLHGNWFDAVAAYNAGSHRVLRGRTPEFSIRYSTIIVLNT